ncbi:hypothetical protein LJR231_005175 [Phyllobacterium sp. LjRoot231]|uniref:hypothetical protein n=1 Tax=Phyllobacterium sp. LjRoot231 TaxID=3342289 RepID=UPI003ED11E14
MASGIPDSLEDYVTQDNPVRVIEVLRARCGEGSSLFGVLRSSAFELSVSPASGVLRGSLLLFGIGCLALPAWDQ